MDGKESQCPIVVLKRGNGPPGPRGAKGVPRCGRGVGTTPRISCLTSVSPRNHPVVWGTAIPQCDEPGAFNVHARICGSSREKSLERPGPQSQVSSAAGNPAGLSRRRNACPFLYTPARSGGTQLNRSSPPLSKAQVRGRSRHRRKQAPARDVASTIPTMTSVEPSGTAAVTEAMLPLRLPTASSTWFEPRPFVVCRNIPPELPAILLAPPPIKE